MRRIGAWVALAVISVLLVGGAIAYGNSLSRPPGGAVVLAGVSPAALARQNLVLEPVATSPLCDLHDWTVEHKVAIPLGRCPISRADAIRIATAQPRAPVCPPGVMCAQLRAAAQGSGPAAAMLILPHQDTVVDSRLVNAISPSIAGSGAGGRVAWAVSVNRVYGSGTVFRPAPTPYLTLVDGYSGALLTSIPAR